MEDNNQKPLTLNELSKYSHEVIFPYINEHCASSDDLIKFKNEILTGQDKILEKLDIFLTEKPIKDEQDKRKQKVLEIHNGALKRGKILSAEESLQIDQMGAF